MKPIKKVLIVGGGTAGWMTAAALSRMLDLTSVEVTLIESEQIGTIGVGEATIPNIIAFNEVLGISEPEFMRETAATIKYGIEFVNWRKDGEAYFHPFGSHGVDMNGIPFHQYWHRFCELDSPHAIEEFCMTAKVAVAGKAATPSRDPDSPLSLLSHAYQMDAGLYAQFLRRYSEARGLNRIEGKIVGVDVHTETEFISSVETASGQRLEADLFIDCSGFRALLLGQALDVKFEDWSHWLPVNKAVTAQTEKTNAAQPFTRATARASGWQWRIPLQHRIGNGFVFCDRFQDVDSAIKMFEDSLEGKRLTDIRTLSFMSGRRQKFWYKNCVGIGLAGGFLEPLESTSIYLIQSGIKALISLFPDASCAEVEQQEYNNLMHKEFDQIRDFLLLHYVLNDRHGEPFWDDFRNMELPDSLRRKIDLFKANGRFFRYDGDLFSETSWIAVMLGQGLIPNGHNPVVNTMPANEIKDRLHSLKRGISQTVAKLPDHEDFLAKSGRKMKDMA